MWEKWWREKASLSGCLAVKHELPGDKGERRVCCKFGSDISMVKYKQEEATKRKWVKIREKMLLSKALLQGKDVGSRTQTRKRTPLWRKREGREGHCRAVCEAACMKVRHTTAYAFCFSSHLYPGSKCRIHGIGGLNSHYLTPRAFHIGYRVKSALRCENMTFQSITFLAIQLQSLDWTWILFLFNEWLKTSYLFNIFVPPFPQ